MLIDDIDFADLYLQQLRLAHRTEKTPDHWDHRITGINGRKKWRKIAPRLRTATCNN